jgi:cobalamin synthase
VLAFAAVVATAAAVGIGLPGPGSTALAVALALTGGAAVLFRRAIGGTTGDTFGAVAKLVEVSSYVVFAAFWS